MRVPGRSGTQELKDEWVLGKEKRQAGRGNRCKSSGARKHGNPKPKLAGVKTGGEFLKAISFAKKSF